MIAITRAVSTLVITITNPDAPIVDTLRAAAAALPDGIVEWTTPEQAANVVASTVSPQDAARTLAHS
jgi:hypothetical protein